MTEKPGGGRSVEEVLDLLKDPEFCADATRTITEAAAMAAQASSFEEWEPRAKQLGGLFLERWGVPPPTSGELADPDPRRRFVDAIASGRWGVVPVFPGVTNRQIQASIKKIRSVIRKQHQDALANRHAQLLRWLEVIGFGRPTIARTVFGRQTGLRRPTKAAVIARTPERRERQLYKQYRGLGLTDKQIEQKIYKRLRGSEVPASAAVRMAEQRYVTRLKGLNKNLAMPVQSEPLSHALTTLFRSLPDENDATVKRHAIAVRDAFVHAAVPDEPPHHQSPEAVVVSVLWGIVPVFPWTTDADSRASVGKLRLMMRPQSQGSPGLAQTPRPRPFEPLSDGLISLFQALGKDDVVVRRHALEARAIFFRPGAL
jgi:hypothetical protein